MVPKPRYFGRVNALDLSPLVAATRPPDLFDPAKHLLDSANVGEP
jgi:hypothetical protein